MKIKIIQGAYGWRPNNDERVKTVRRGQTCDVSPDEAKRLIAIGVAEHATEETVTKPDSDTGSNGGGTTTTGQDDTPSSPCFSADALPKSAAGVDITDGHFVEESLKAMANPDLKTLATDLGLDPKKCRNKGDYITLLMTVEIIEDDEDGEDDPLLQGAPGDTIVQ